MKYMEADDIIKINDVVISNVKKKKKDKHQLWSRGQIIEAINESKEGQDVYDKSANLLYGLVRKDVHRHPFSSANRRTAFVSSVKMLKDNKAPYCISDSEYDAKAMTGIREGYYTHEEIKNWLKNGKIKQFVRRF